MKTPSFIGRQEELFRLESLTRKQSSSLVVIHGRRRIGKSRLTQEFGKKRRFLSFSGLPPHEGTKAQEQRNEFARRLSKQTDLPPLQMHDWGDLFSLLARETKQGQVIIVLDEISWMAAEDPLFLGKLKNAWDWEFKQNPELILILCGSVSSWIEENILKSTGFMGRLSLTLFLQELSITASNQLLEAQGFQGSDYDRFKILSITGGIPRYLEEVQPHIPVEANIKELCFREGGVLFREFDDIFSDIFSKRSGTYKKIIQTIVSGSKELNDIAKELDITPSGHLTECLTDLIQQGFITRDYTWNFKGEGKKLSHFRLSDNYLRFYLKCIEPNRFKIEKHHFVNSSVTSLPGWDSLMALQFENLVVNNHSLLIKYLPCSFADIVNEGPFFQRKTVRAMGCQIDYLIQTRYNTLFVCEIKFSRNPIRSEIIEEMKEKIHRLSLPKGFSCFPFLIHVNGVSDSVIEQEYFTRIIDFSSMLHG